MRLIDADKLYPDCISNKGGLAISQSQIANAETIEQETGEWIFDESDGSTSCSKCTCVYGLNIIHGDVNFVLIVVLK